jgi:hypothetical protein
VDLLQYLDPRISPTTNISLFIIQRLLSYPDPQNSLVPVATTNPVLSSLYFFIFPEFLALIISNTLAISRAKYSEILLLTKELNYPSRQELREYYLRYKKYNIWDHDSQFQDTTEKIKKIQVLAVLLVSILLQQTQLLFAL